MITQGEKDNILRWNNRRGHYEVYYIKFNHRDSGTAYWLRYTLLAPVRGDILAEVWGIYFDPRDARNTFALKDTFPLSETQFSREKFYFRVGPSSLHHGGAKGELKNYGRSLRWNLKFAPGRMSFRHFPHASMYTGSLPKTKVLSPHFDARVSGTMEVDGTVFDCAGEPGQQTHIWGTKHAERWTWGHCNAFAEDPAAIFEGLSARIRIGPWTAPALSPMFIRWKGTDYVMNGLFRSALTRSFTDLPEWTFQARHGSLLFTGTMKAPLADFVGVEYTDPDGEKLWCSNTKIADLAITIRNKGLVAGTLTSARSAAFEVVSRVRDPRVEIRI